MTSLEKWDAVQGRLDGIAATLHVMATAYDEDNNGTPTPATTQEALVFIAQQIEEVNGAISSIFEQEKAGN